MLHHEIHTNTYTHAHTVPDTDQNGSSWIPPPPYSARAPAPCPKFSKVSALVHLLYEATTEAHSFLFENVHTASNPPSSRAKFSRNCPDLAGQSPRAAPPCRNSQQSVSLYVFSVNTHYMLTLENLSCIARRVELVTLSLPPPYIYIYMYYTSRVGSSLIFERQSTAFSRIKQWTRSQSTSTSCMFRRAARELIAPNI
jgi:hypothetical protein